MGGACRPGALQAICRGRGHASTCSIFGVRVPGILEARQDRKGSNVAESVTRQRYQHAIHHLELAVMTHNEAGIALYRRRGIEIEGIKKHYLHVGGRYVDEYYMARLLEKKQEMNDVPEKYYDIMNLEL